MIDPNKGELIHKFTLPEPKDGIAVLNVPGGALPFAVVVTPQQELVAYALVDPYALREKVELVVLPTGGQFSAELASVPRRFLGTHQVRGVSGVVVWHVWV